MRPSTPASLFAALLACTSLSCRGGEGERSTTSATPPVERTADAGGEQPDEPAPEPATPKLVVVIVVDQMRADYLERFDSDLEHGFARLRERGRVFTQARHLHGMTETAPGHATIVTGAHPNHHGVIANRWYDYAAGKKLPAVEDPGARNLLTGETGSASPAQLLREGLGDWLQAKHADSIVVSISLKDRASVLMGAKRPDLALWYDDAAGGFTSSTYYAEQLPAWVTAYNELDRAAQLYGSEGWVPSKPLEAYGSSRAKTDPAYVTTYNDFSLTKQFPHVIDVEGKAPRNVVRDVPFGDQMSLELARAAIEHEGMGQDASPDLLLLSMSGGDYAGHRYGPNSLETHDYYLRLDAQLGTFLDTLDERVGADSYVLLLTADHGVAPMPEYSEVETAGRFVGKRDVPPLMEAAAKAAGLSAELIPELVYTFGAHLLFDEAVDAPARAKFLTELAAVGRADPRLANVWTRDELLSADASDPLVAAQLRSFHPERSPDLVVLFAPGVVPYPSGTNHGTPYEYDQRVPLILLGAGAPGSVDAPVASVDIAPTLAGLLDLPVPEGVDGTPLALD